ncbi:transporter substrate-binding domain-containing protein [Legionella sp. D16C41]|uniref:transporter substrate-binding domain-containing protein n=1 Tax=Legionella sp. D16C41 TaxID=3402688 RepID=UPI003AF44A92
MIRKLLYYIVFSVFSFASTAYAVVKIGTLQFDPPFVTTDNHFVSNGFDIDLMKNICTELSWQCEFVTYNEYDKLVDALIDHHIDYAISGIVIIPLKDNRLLFSLPYLLSAGTFLTLKKNTDINDLASLKDKKIGVLDGRGYGEYLKQNADLLKINVVDYHNYMDLFNDLYDGKVDAIFMNNYTGLYLLHRYPNYVKLVNTSIRFADGIGILSRADNKENIDKINALLNKFESDGTFIKLYNYNFAFFIKQ